MIIHSKSIIVLTTKEMNKFELNAEQQINVDSTGINMMQNMSIKLATQSDSDFEIHYPTPRKTNKILQTNSNKKLNSTTFEDEDSDKEINFTSSRHQFRKTETYHEEEETIGKNVRRRKIIKTQIEDILTKNLNKFQRETNHHSKLTRKMKKKKK